MPFDDVGSIEPSDDPDALCQAIEDVMLHFLGRVINDAFFREMISALDQRIAPFGAHTTDVAFSDGTVTAVGLDGRGETWTASLGSGVAEGAA